MLIRKIEQKQSGIFLYGITPPKRTTHAERLSEIAAAQTQRIKKLNPDALVIYDIQDEAMRQPASRPFPFAATLDPVHYGKAFLGGVDIPKIYYRAVGKYSADAFASDLLGIKDEAAVFVGSPSSRQQGGTSLADAYAIRRRLTAGSTLGGVAIPERHMRGADEHLRVVRKMVEGCSFFVTQCVYDADTAKSFLSDYHYHCREAAIEMVPIIFTITPCGSLKTLEFMKWLGIHIPRWLENDLVHAGNILEASMNACTRTFAEIQAFAIEKNIPVGCNIESVATRKDEIEASLQLGVAIRALMKT